MLEQFTIHPTQRTLRLEICDYLSDSCKQISCTEPITRSIIIGEINQLKLQELSNQHNLEQMVKKSTRGPRTLDLFFTKSDLTIWQLWLPQDSKLNQNANMFTSEMLGTTERLLWKIN